MLRVFLSYSHADEVFKEKLDKHLVMLRRNKKIDVWNDRQILASEKWDDSIREALEQADIILLLVSSDFLASTYIWETELAIAMKRYEEKKAVIVPIILRDCDWQDSPFHIFQALPKNAQAVTTWADEDVAYLNIAKGIRDLVESLSSK